MTSQPPRYELRFNFFKGAPIVEVLKDDGPIHAYDRHFKFGLEKATLGSRLIRFQLAVERALASGWRRQKLYVQLPKSYARGLGEGALAPLNQYIAGGFLRPRV
jgi:hypothetical protein